MGLTYPVIFLFILIITELMIIASRFNEESSILPSNITTFPISKTAIYFYMLSCLVLDSKLLLFLIPMPIFFIYAAQISIVLSIISLFTMTLFYLILELFILDFYLAMSRVLQRFKENIGIIHISLILAFVILNSIDRTGFITTIPVMSWIDSSIGSAFSGNYLAAYQSLVGLLVVAILLWYGGIQIVKRVNLAV